MDKKKFINLFLEEDPSIISSLYDKIELCKKINGTIYSDIFLPPQIWSKLIEYEVDLEILVEVEGLSKDSEKKMVAFKSYYSEDFIDFPIKFIKITPKSKFIKLEHRHFLGSILSTGIKREKLGDLIVNNGEGFTVIHKGLYDFLITHLKTIGKTNIEINEVGKKDIPPYKFIVEDYLLASQRLDLVVATFTHKSRNEGAKLVESSQVMLNYKTNTNKSFNIKNNDLITIRRYGKFIFLGSAGETKKGKLKVKFKKFI